ncbi:MAG: carboxypeptidase-like regulatory domain-containing protein [Planctomycetaceae bacterium]|jgi:hypothetical protein|nr:carboxypeptidase-like regulatory domain-containing protein [Planctomycetaceae bacterium]
MRQINFIVLFIFVTIIFGCGDKSRPVDLPPLYPCTITITQDGKPLAEASVTLEPADPANVKYKASALTGADGSVKMKTYGFDGTPIGKYKIVVTKIINENIEVKLNESTGKEEATSYQKYRLVEPKFTSAETTPLEIEVNGKDKKLQKNCDVGKPIKEAIE